MTTPIDNTDDPHELEISLTVDPDQPIDGQAVVETVGESIGGDE